MVKERRRREGREKGSEEKRLGEEAGEEKREIEGQKSQGKKGIWWAGQENNAGHVRVVVLAAASDMP